MLATVRSQPHRTVVPHSYVCVRSLNHFGTNTQVHQGSFTPPPEPFPLPPPFPTTHTPKLSTVFYLKSLEAVPLEAITFSIKHLYKTTLLNNTFNIVK